MSGEIGFHIQEEILRMLPVKSLLRFRCVCKAWRCLIDSSYFLAAHTVGQDQWQHLFVRYLVRGRPHYICVVDDDTFPRQRSVPTLPLSIKLLTRSRVVGSCNGLVCLDGYYDDPDKSQKPMVVLWNPSIRKSIAIAVPVLLSGMNHWLDETTFGFGVCPATNDPKIVMIPQLAPLHEKSSKINDAREVMVYTLSSGKWKRLSNSSNVPSKAVRVRRDVQVIDRFIYWSGSHLMAEDGCSWSRWISNMILSFDMTNDTFEVIDLPDSLALCLPTKVCISKLRESLVIFESLEEMCSVSLWMMDNGVQKSFTKLFTIIAQQYWSIRALGLGKSGAPIMEVKGVCFGESEIAVYEPKSQSFTPIMEVKNVCSEESEIVAYEPNSQRFSALEIGGIRSFSTANSYTETLLLLGAMRLLVGAWMNL
ncbi:unnamed protein product [Lactuca saligna]|uniref:F-box domain-containing protein n=1 Tax=Lactuca saligna TaxID=75948 RepID=A0AA35YAD8_LACSI|nr:unnamed protein product [Lactuca saligna]